MNEPIDVEIKRMADEFGTWGLWRMAARIEKPPKELSSSFDACASLVVVTKQHKILAAIIERSGYQTNETTHGRLKLVNNARGVEIETLKSAIKEALKAIDNGFMGEAIKRLQAAIGEVGK